MMIRVRIEIETIKIIIIDINVCNLGKNNVRNKNNEIIKIPKDEIFKATKKILNSFKRISKNRYLKLNLFSKLKSLF